MWVIETTYPRNTEDSRRYLGEYRTVHAAMLLTTSGAFLFDTKKQAEDFLKECEDVPQLLSALDYTAGFTEILEVDESLDDVFTPEMGVD